MNQFTSDPLAFPLFVSFIDLPPGNAKRLSRNHGNLSLDIYCGQFVFFTHQLNLGVITCAFSLKKKEKDNAYM